MKRILALALFFPVALFAQIPLPQIPLTGSIGCLGFPCVNSGTLVMPSDADYTMTAQDTSAFYLAITSSVSLTATRNIIAPSGRFPFTIENATTGGQSIQIIGQSGTGITIANGTTVAVWNDGTNFVQVGSSGGGTGNVTTNGSPQAGYIPVWASPSSIGNSLIDYGITTPSVFTLSAPVNIAGTGPSQFAFVYNATPVVPGSSTSAVYGVDSSGHGVMSEAGGSAARICNSTNGVCAGSGTVVASPQFQLPYFSAAGTSTTLTGDSKIFTDGSGNLTVNSLTFPGAISGNATIQAQSAAGSPTFTLGTVSGQISSTTANTYTLGGSGTIAGTDSLSVITLTGSTTFTLPGVNSGAWHTLCFIQGASSYVVTAPANVHGFQAIGNTNGDWNCQNFIYSAGSTRWVANGSMQTNIP